MENLSNPEWKWHKQPQQQTAIKNNFPTIKILFFVLLGLALIFSAFILVDGIKLAIGNGGFAKMNFFEQVFFKLLGVSGILFAFIALATLSFVFALRLIYKYFR